MRIPSYRRHATGQATCRLAGTDYYLGTYGTSDSHERYNRLVAEWVAAGRPRHWKRRAVASAITVAHLADRFQQHAARWYKPNQENGGEAGVVRSALRWLLASHGSMPAAQFAPLALRAVRQAMVAGGVARTTANAYTTRIRRMFRWAVSEELVSLPVYEALRTLQGLFPGRDGVREAPAVEPVPESALAASLALLRPVYRDMVRLQLLTGMRPGEVLSMRPRDLQVRPEVWLYRPATHKNAHRGKRREVWIGPQAQEVLRPYLQAKDTDGPVFRARASRPVTGPSYRAAIVRACERAGVERWHPHQLRHNAATRILAETGSWDTARAILGHSRPDTTAIYAERDRAAAEGVVRRLG